MFKGLKETLTGSDSVYIAGKRVTVKKLTPNKWKELFGTIDRLPGLVIQVLSVTTDDFYAYALNAIDLAMDEIIDVVAVLTKLDRDFIADNAGIDEIIEYLQRTVKINRLDTLAKNVKSLLPHLKD